jgi:hypothetical protein
MAPPSVKTNVCLSHSLDVADKRSMNALADDCNDLELSMHYELRAQLFV